jgi:hypothetical protein
MLSEISAATAFLGTLFVSTLSTNARDNFASSLSDKLCERFTGNWYENDGERGSAGRAIVWQSHGGGEGYDEDLASVCLETVCTGKDRQQLDNIFALPFTLWIDPGCVAVRLGHGPGVYTAGMTVTQHQTASSIRVIHGAIPARPAVLTSVAALQPPMLALLPSTPALGADADEEQTKKEHWSNCSSYVNGHAMATRSVSSGGCSVLTVGSRVSSGTMSATTDECDEACPSLAAPSSSRGDSESDFEGGSHYDEDDDVESSSQLSIQDMMERIGFSNIDIIDDDDDDDEEEEEGDMTIRIDTAHKANSVTNYDGGNVGVMGGGVRLGGARKPSSPSKPRMSNAWPTDALAGLQSLPLPASKSAQWSKPTIVSALSSPFSAHGVANGNMFSPSYTIVEGNLVALAPPSSVEAMADAANKRARSRGRRSRGRGAGRAARRQAAAMLKAAQLYNGEGPWHAQYLTSETVMQPGHQQRVATPRQPSPSMSHYAGMAPSRTYSQHHHQQIPSPTPIYNQMPTMQYPTTNVNQYLSAGHMAVMPQWQAAAPIRAYH